MLTSTKASVESSTILTYITTAEFGTGAWNGSSESFILHWQNQVSEYAKLVNTADIFSKTIKRSMLENDIDGLAELRNFKTTTAQIQVTNGTVISYDEYVSLLYGVTQSYDKQLSIQINSKGQKCTVCQYENHFT